MNIYSLKRADYAERGQQVEIIVDGVSKRQTIIFSGTDYFEVKRKEPPVEQENYDVPELGL